MLVTVFCYGITYELFEKCKNEFFSKPILFNFIELTKYVCDKYQISYDVIYDLLMILEDGEKYLYDDSYDFILKMKKKSFNISLLTYGNTDFQKLKLLPLGICDIIDSIIISNNYKFQLNLNYKSSIFIDDNPRDLLGLLHRGAQRVIRIKRKDSKYCNKQLKNGEIVSFSNLKDITF